ncbi:SRPBCC family protein [Streptosporangium sp. NPDC000396]|uniref:SRPBCC family protein n=1 Tax=Streptosporangium sp. NPDC000396 TaxID=3366185 RepID=UPI00368652BB
MSAITTRGEPDVSVSIEIAAPPELVYALVSDVPNLPSWAAECVRCRWLGKAAGPAEGVRFLGVNRNKFFVWPTVSEIRHADPGRRFSWEVLGGIAYWEYVITPAPGGCTVTESTWDLRGFALKHVLAPLMSGVRDRRVANRRNMALTLDRLKLAAEAAHLGKA